MEEQSQEKQLLEKIKTGEAKMLPKSYFVGRTALLVVTVFLAGILAIFLFSFAVFYISSSGYSQLSHFGAMGLPGMFLSFPWLTAIVLLIFLLILAYLIFNSTGIGHKPSLYSIILIIIVVTLFGLAVAKTSFHARFLNRAIQNNLPVIGAVYRGYGIMHSDSIFSGTATQVNDSGFVLETENGSEIPVVCGSNTRYPKGKIIEGDPVMVLGSMSDGKLSAYGVNYFRDRDDIYFQGRGMMGRGMMGN